ncbi:MAG: hypothetical protein IKF83_04950, partial [Clostridia bacterium]|nr:hypothetical protein [Clostridia bacterium]
PNEPLASAIGATYRQVIFKFGSCDTQGTRKLYISKAKRKNGTNCNTHMLQYGQLLPKVYLDLEKRQ